MNISIAPSDMPTPILPRGTSGDITPVEQPLHSPTTSVIEAIVEAVSIPELVTKTFMEEVDLDLITSNICTK